VDSILCGMIYSHECLCNTSHLYAHIPFCCTEQLYKCYIRANAVGTDTTLQPEFDKYLFQATRTQPEYQPVESDPENLPLRDMAQAVASLSPLRSGFAPESFHVEFVVGKVALGHNFLRVLCFPLSVSFHHGPTSSNITSEMNSGRSSETWCHPVDINSNKGQ
jgi:hypothetical protein